MSSNWISFDRAVDFYDETRGFPSGLDGEIAAFMRETGDLKKTDRVLEIGIGTGRIALPLSAYVGAIYGADISRGMMEKLRAKQNGEAIYLTQADAGRLPFDDNTFDIVVVVHVFHLVPDPEQVSRELQRVLKPGGKLMHGKTWRGDSRMNLIRDAWMPIVTRTRPERNWQRADSMLDEQGWKLLDDPIFKYTRTGKPADFLQSIEGRYWSSTWEMSDEEIAEGVAAIKRAIDEHFNGDAETVVEQLGGFKVQVYAPPV